MTTGVEIHKLIIFCQDLIILDRHSNYRVIGLYLFPIRGCLRYELIYHIVWLALPILCLDALITLANVVFLKFNDILI